MKFADRTQAGQMLAEALKSRFDATARDATDLLVLAIPTGGIPVGTEIASALHVPFDVWLAQKISAPDNREFAIGSVASNGELYIDEMLVDALRISQPYLDREIARCREELEEKMLLYRGSEKPVDVAGKTVILVDDGIATGATALAALASLQRAGAKRRILAAPVAALNTVKKLERQADEIVVLQTPSDFAAVGAFYDDFSQLSRQQAAEMISQVSRNT